jgi:hypothetical protein
METNKNIAFPGYLISLMLFALPLFDNLTSVWPPRLGEERWRFGAVGSLSNVTLLPLIGILFAIAIAIMLNHRRTRRVIGGLCAFFAVVLAALLVIFVLDFFQMRTQIRPQFKHVIDVASATSLVKQTFTILALTLLSWVGLSGRKAMTKEKVAPTTTTVTPLIPLTGAPRAE